MSDKPRVRFAPSPTGALHIGGVRTALYNYLFARKHGGTFILRIEDTDQQRYVAGAERYIIDTLEYCGLELDEGPGVGGDYGPYRQSERKGRYEEYAYQLVENGYAYYAFDTPEDLDRKRNEAEQNKQTFAYNIHIRKEMVNSLTLSEEETKSKIESKVPFVIRLKVPEDETIEFDDQIRGHVSIKSDEVDDKVILKADGMPTYHLANVVDDYQMKITHVIRGEEWLPSTPLHVLLYRYLGWEENRPAFVHLPLILKPSGGGKLSKRDGDKLGFPVFPLSWHVPGTHEIWPGFKQEGFLSRAFVNYLAMLGWNPGTEQEIFTIKELIEAFSIDRIQKAGARFDYEKAKWFNEQFIQSMDMNEMADKVSHILVNKGIHLELEKIIKICDLMKERVTFLKEIPQKGHYFFVAPTEYDKKSVRKKWKENTPEIVDALKNIFADSDSFEAAVLENKFKEYVESEELGFGMAMIGLRLCISGEGGGPPLFDIMEIIGKEESIHRLEVGTKSISAMKQPSA